ncbi:MAG: (2Fe-2S)-binding protein, partial [Clostridia bacterium]|nr:(2Fe-2S)-binding protein [Clostridia bacterium]
DIDGVKKRTRSGMGRCQGGFCQPFVAEILARELGKNLLDITKSGPGSSILVGKVKEV